MPKSFYLQFKKHLEWYQRANHPFLQEVALAYEELANQYIPKKTNGFYTLTPLEQSQWQHQIILMTYRYWQLATDNESKRTLQLALGRYLNCSYAKNSYPASSKIEKAMKQQGYLLPACNAYLNRLEKIRHTVAQQYQHALKTGEDVGIIRKQFSHFQHPNPQTYFSFPLTRGMKKSGYRTWLSKQSRQLNGIQQAAYQTVSKQLENFAKEPYLTPIKRFFRKTALGGRAFFNPTTWGQPELSDVVYRIARMLNRIGSKDYISEIQRAFFALKEHPNPQEALKSFHQFLIEQFMLIQNTPLKDLSESQKRLLVLREFKMLINQLGELTSLPNRLSLTCSTQVTYTENGELIEHEHRLYEIQPAKPLDYKKRNGRIFKAALKQFSDMNTFIVAAGQAFITYTFVGAFTFFLGPAAPFVLFFATASTLYVSYRLFKNPTRQMSKQFIYKRNFLNGHSATKTGLIMLMGVIVAAAAAISSGFIVFMATAVSLPFAPIIAAAPFIAVFIGTVTAICYTGLMHKLIGDMVNDVHQSLKAFRKKSEEKLNPLKRAFLMIKEHWKHPLRVPDPLHPSRTIADITATPAAKNYKRIEWIVGVPIKAAFMLLGVIVFAVASLAVIGAMYSQIAAGLQYWLHLSTVASQWISFVVVGIITGISSALYNARTAMVLSTLIAQKINNLVATPLVNLAFRCVQTLAGKDNIFKAVGQGTVKLATAALEFIKAVPKDPQKTILPVLHFCKKLAFDSFVLIGNAVGAGAFILRGAALSLSTFGKVLGGFVGSLAMNFVSFNDLENLRVPNKLAPVYQPPADAKKTKKAERPATLDAVPDAPPAPSTPSLKKSVTELSAEPPDTRIYKNQSLTANFNFFPSLTKPGTTGVTYHFPEAPLHQAAPSTSPCA